MKKIFIIFFVCVCAAAPAFAQTFEDGTIDKMVDVSLEGLKRSYQKLADQNRLLVSKAEGYRAHIQLLRQELALLESRKGELSGTLRDPAGTNVALPETVYRQDIEQLKKKIDATSEKAIQKTFRQRKNELDAALARNKKSLRATIKPATEDAAVAQLKARQAQLQQQLVDRQAGAKPESTKKYAGQLDKEIAKLKSRQRELEKKLSSAQKKELTNINGLTEESYLLRRKFVNLYDENIRLKREMFHLGTIVVSPQP